MEITPDDIVSTIEGVVTVQQPTPAPITISLDDLKRNAETSADHANMAAQEASDSAAQAKKDADLYQAALDKQQPVLQVNVVEE